MCVVIELLLEGFHSRIKIDQIWLERFKISSNWFLYLQQQNALQIITIHSSTH